MDAAHEENPRCTTAPYAVALCIATANLRTPRVISGWIYCEDGGEESSSRMMMIERQPYGATVCRGDT